MKIFIVCTVRNASDSYLLRLNKYVKKLENDGHIVHLPPRDTKQDAKGIDICKQNRDAIFMADEIHIFYNSKSQGTHFDMGMAFMAQKPILIVDNELYGEGKSFPRMLHEWEEDNPSIS